jgi:hypothetical protein
MRSSFSDNADLLAIAFIVLMLGLGSAFKLETTRVVEGRSRPNITRVRLAGFERELMVREQAVEILRKIDCRR